MRIRKRARISPPPPPLPSPISQQQQPSSSIVPNSPATHVCELNRSPWDVISFTSQSQEQYGFQIKVDDNDTCNWGPCLTPACLLQKNDTCNCVERVEACSPDSIVSLNEQYWAKKEIIEETNRPSSLMVDVDKVKAKKKVNKAKKEEPNYICCNKTDGKGWFCKKEAKEGEVLCEHHIEQLKSYKFNYTYSCRKSTKAKPEVATATAAAAAPTTTTTMASKKRNRGKVSSPSPMDFYYYSGFGPKYSWGSSRRGGGGNRDKIKEIKKEENNVDNSTNTNIAEASSSPAAHVHVVDLHDYEHYDDVFDDDEDDEYNGDKKRIRRSIKARSLKSLL